VISIATGKNNPSKYWEFSYLSEIIGMTSHPYFVVSGNNEVDHENF
jgi:hypothetical protein